MGLFATERHDKDPWKKSDAWRARKAGQKLGFTASVGEFRADWLCLKQVFSFGGWNAERMCWMCRATQPSGEAPYTDVAKSALWRSLRMKGNQCLEMLVARGKALSPLFSLPAFIIQYIIIDCLHAIDLGVAADVAGSFFAELIFAKDGFLAGPTVENRVSALWILIKEQYKLLKTPCRLQALTKEMIVKSTKNAKPKLRAKVGEMRHLVPCILAIAKEYCKHVGETAHAKTVVNLFSRLMDFYMFLGINDFQAETLSRISYEFSLLYKALAEEKVQKTRWFLKPKLHLMQELCEYMVHDHGDPSGYWTYMDEDFVGFIAKMASSRGGPRKAKTAPTAVMARYSAL